jgi:hypothetical protein
MKTHHITLNDIDFSGIIIYMGKTSECELCEKAPATTTRDFYHRVNTKNNGQVHLCNKCDRMVFLYGESWTISNNINIIKKKARAADNDPIF